MGCPFREDGSMDIDYSAKLPDGNFYSFWKDETVYDRVLHVDALKAERQGDGSREHPFRTISEAAKLAVPGTKVLIHAGLYRECVRPAQGGASEKNMICYEAAGDGEVKISASEQVTDFIRSTGWQLQRGRDAVKDVSNVRVWEHKLDPDMFRGYNPFCAVNILHDRLFIEYAKTDMTPYLNRRGCVFCDGEMLHQVPLYHFMAAEENTYWVEANGQKIHFRLKGDADPKDHLIEITVREQCFAPDTPFLSFIHLKGITAEHAAMGAPVPQRGAISCYRGHHWIIENCFVNWANAVGIDVGNECWHHETEQDRLCGYTIIRGCRIKDAGVCGIAGLFAKQLLIENNVIEGTGWQKMELSWEAGAIKLHNSENALIRGNLFRNTFRADHIWLDCGNMNNRITQNLFLDGIEQREAIFIECTRDGVNLIDNNIIWNVEGRFDPAKIPDEPGSSGWYKLRENEAVNGYGIYGEGTDHLYIAHNLIAGCRHSGYYSKPVSFRLGFDRGGTSRKARVFGNIFYDCGEAAIDFPTMDNESERNLFVRMLGGYLRVMYPEPEVCLHLPAWREFCGFDLEGQNGWFDITLDKSGEKTGDYTFTVKTAEKGPMALPGMLDRMEFEYDPASVRKVKRDLLSDCDITGQIRGENTVSGPFAVLEGEKKLHFGN